MKMKYGVWVSLGCYNKSPQSWVAFNNRNVFSHSSGQGLELPPKALRENPSSSLPASGGLRHSLAVATSFVSTSSSHGLLFLSTRLSSLCLLEGRTLILGFSIYLDNLGWSHVQIPNLITSPKAPSSNKAPLTGLMSLNNLWETEEDRGAWRASVYGIVEHRTWLSDWTTQGSGHGPTVMKTSI